MSKPRNILIVGSSGSGKSTLSKKLSQILGLRIINMDHIYWQPGWIMRSQEEITTLVLSEIEHDGWIFEGNNSITFPQRVAKADMLLWLDLPRETCIWRVIKRSLKHHGKTRPDMPKGCPERLNWSFLKWIWNYNKVCRPALEKLYHETQDQLERTHLKSAKDVDLFIESMGARLEAV